MANELTVTPQRIISRIEVELGSSYMALTIDDAKHLIKELKKSIKELEE